MGTAAVGAAFQAIHSPLLVHPFPLGVEILAQLGEFLSDALDAMLEARPCKIPINLLCLRRLPFTEWRAFASSIRLIRDALATIA